MQTTNAANTCLANDILHLILLPTEACNFRCSYCYEEFGRARMQPAVLQGVKNLISRRIDGLRQLQLSWFGGEPLLAFDLIEDILVHVNRHLSLRPRGVLQSDMTTNAYLLTGARFERLLDLGVQTYQISFDGPRDIHDEKRVLAGGRPTFDVVWANACGMQRVPGDFRAIIRLHVDGESAPRLPAFIDDFAATFSGDRRFCLFIRATSRLGGPRDTEIPVLDERLAVDVVSGLRAYAEACGIMLYQVADQPVCYAARANSWIVRTDGRLNKCSLRMDHPENAVGRLAADGRVDVDDTKLRPWLRGLWERDGAALACPMRGLPKITNETQITSSTPVSRTFRADICSSHRSQETAP